MTIIATASVNHVNSGRLLRRSAVLWKSGDCLILHWLNLDLAQAKIDAFNYSTPSSFTDWVEH